MTLDENKNNPLGTSNIGCVWEKQGKKGIFYSGMINGQDVIMLPNNTKSDKAPRFIFIKPRGQQAQTGDV